jgi:proton-coupled amino acid transporter
MTRSTVRAGVVLFTAAVAYALGGALDNLVALVGALCSLPLAFIYPALFNDAIFDGANRARDRAIVVFGVLVMVLATGFAIATWEATDPETCIKI